MPALRCDADIEDELQQLSEPSDAPHSPAGGSEAEGQPRKRRRQRQPSSDADGAGGSDAEQEGEEEEEEQEEGRGRRIRKRRRPQVDYKALHQELFGTAYDDQAGSGAESDEDRDFQPGAVVSPEQTKPKRVRKQRAAPASKAGEEGAKASKPRARKKASEDGSEEQQGEEGVKASKPRARKKKAQGDGEQEQQGGEQGAQAGKEGVKASKPRARKKKEQKEGKEEAGTGSDGGPAAEASKEVQEAAHGQEAKVEAAQEEAGCAGAELDGQGGQKEQPQVLAGSDGPGLHPGVGQSAEEKQQQLGAAAAEQEQKQKQEQISAETRGPVQQQKPEANGSARQHGLDVPQGQEDQKQPEQRSSKDGAQQAQQEARLDQQEDAQPVKRDLVVQQPGRAAAPSTSKAVLKEPLVERFSDF